eukprot:scaffold30113_cov27-Tisochrysis_lutea.AAC.2
MVHGDLSEARAAVDDALAMQPSHAPALALRETMDDCATIYTTEATKLALLGNASDAVVNLEHARQLRPADASLRVKLAMTFRQQGRLHEAVEVRQAQCWLLCFLLHRLGLLGGTLQTSPDFVMCRR